MITQDSMSIIHNAFKGTMSLTELKMKLDVAGFSYPEDDWSFAKYIASLLRSSSTFATSSFKKSWNEWLEKNIDSLADTNKVQSWISNDVCGRHLSPLNKKLMRTWLQTHTLNLAECKKRKPKASKERENVK